MIEIKKHIGQGFASGELYDVLKQLQNLGLAVGGEVYFVDCNAGSDGVDDGASWDTPYKTLAYAIGVSNANIAAGSHGWASRNSILLKGDSCKEDLTVPPVKCDVIGVGSNDAFNKTEIIGEHAWTGSVTLMSSGFYNIQFVNDGAAAIFTVDSLTGLYFGDCDFIAEADSIHAIHITGGTGHDLRVLNCRIINDEYADRFATAGILIATTTTFWNLVIENSYIEGEIGIKIDTTNLYNGLINNCIVRATTLCIDDDSADCVITNSRFIADGANTANDMLDYNEKLAAGNIATGETSTNNAPVLLDGLTN